MQGNNAYKNIDPIWGQGKKKIIGVEYKPPVGRSEIFNPEKSYYAYIVVH